MAGQTICAAKYKSSDIPTMNIKQIFTIVMAMDNDNVELLESYIKNWRYEILHKCAEFLSYDLDCREIDPRILVIIRDKDETIK